MNEQEYKDWLLSLKEGDEVAINQGSYGFREYKIYKVTKVTPTRIIKLSDGRVFNNTGYERGSSSWGSYRKIQPVTDEVKEQIDRVGLLRIIKNTDFSKVSTAQLREIVGRLER